MKLLCDFFGKIALDILMVENLRAALEVRAGIFS